MNYHRVNGGKLEVCLLLQHRDDLPKWLHVEKNISCVESANINRLLDEFRYRGKSLRDHILTPNSDNFAIRDIVKIALKEEPWKSLFALPDWVNGEIGYVDSDEKQPRILRSSVGDDEDLENTVEGKYESIRFDVRHDGFMAFADALGEFMHENLTRNPHCSLRGFVMPHLPLKYTAHIYGEFNGEILVKMQDDDRRFTIIGINQNDPATFRVRGQMCSSETEIAIRCMVMDIYKAYWALRKIFGEAIHVEIGIRSLGKYTGDNLAVSREDRVGQAHSTVIYHHLQSRRIAPMMGNYFSLCSSGNKCIYEGTWGGLGKLTTEGRRGYIYRFTGEKKRNIPAITMKNRFPDGILYFHSENAVSRDGAMKIDTQQFAHWEGGLVLMDGPPDTTLHLSMFRPYTVANVPDLDKEIIWEKLEPGILRSRDKHLIRFNGWQTRIESIPAQ